MILFKVSHIISFLPNSCSGSMFLSKWKSEPYNGPKAACDLVSHYVSNSEARCVPSLTAHGPHSRVLPLWGLSFNCFLQKVSSSAWLALSCLQVFALISSLTTFPSPPHPQDSNSHYSALLFPLSVHLLSSGCHTFLQTFIMFTVYYLSVPTPATSSSLSLLFTGIF